MELVSSQICKTGDIGIYNNLFGGKLLSWLDEAGGTRLLNKHYLCKN
ncbi:MAG: hypothetical protein K8R63_08205 [Bacteroidales bacterium]|nr:hypothetical protein [Bacteroidales bacterium]